MKSTKLSKLKEIGTYSGGKIYLVGGAVRNNILGYNEVADVDITGNILPEDLSACAKKLGVEVKATYDRTGTVLLNIDGENVEYTTFRKESYGKEVHTPTEVTFGATIEEDALRRDFKCNAVYYDIKEDKYVDILGGTEDIKNKVLSTCRKPDETFGEDGLRLLRLCRFHAELGFAVPEETRSGAYNNRKLINGISKERILSEFDRIFKADTKYDFSPKDGHYQGFELMSEIRVLDEIIPELTKGRNMPQPEKYHKYDVLEHTLKTVLYARQDIRLFALFHDIGKPYAYNLNGNYHGHEKYGEEIAKEVLKRLKASNEIIDKTARLTALHMEDSNCEEKEKKLRFKLVKNADIFDELIALKEADYKACKDDTETVPQTVVKWERLMAEMKSDGTPFSLKDLKVNGNDLKKMGYSGKEIGEKLEEIFRICVVNPAENDREMLAKRLKKQKNKENM